MDIEYKTLEEKFNGLPLVIQHALTSPQVIENIKSIASKNNLMIDQASVLFDLTSYVLLGLLPSNKFVKTLSEETKLPENIAKTIAEDINKEVFEKIRTAMREAGQQKTPENIPNQPRESLEPATKQPIQRPIYSPFQQSYKPKPTHITDLEKAGDFIIENDSNSTFEDNIPAKPVNFSSPVKPATPIPTEGPITPKNNESQSTISTPSITENKPEETLNTEKPDLSIPATTDQAEMTENNTNPDVTFETNGTENNLKTRTTEEKSEQKSYKEPLADHLLDMLDNNSENNNQTEDVEKGEIEKQTPIPDNLPIMEETKKDEPLKTTKTIPQVPTTQEKSSIADVYREPIE